MALHPDFPRSPHAVLDPAVRWFPADETLRDTGMEKLMPPLVANVRRKVKEFRTSGKARSTRRNTRITWISASLNGARLMKSIKNSTKRPCFSS
jgi:hypothetical protein